MDRKLKNSGIVFIIFSTMMVIYFHLADISHYNDTGLIFGSVNYNIVAYVGAFGISALLFFFFNIEKMDILDKERLNTIKKVAYIVFFVCVVGFLYSVYKNETRLFAYDSSLKAFARWRVSPNKFICIMIVLIGILFFIAKNKKIIGKKFRQWIAILVSLGCAVLTFAPNIFSNNMYGIWHTHAYTNSIISVARFAPYDNVRSSIYGHYGLIYLPFVKLLGNDYRAVALTIALFTFITFLCIYYVISNYISHDGLYAVVVMAVSAIRINYFGSGQYFQILPHRYFFPFMALAFLVWQLHTKIDRKIIILLEVVFGVLAVTWNLEMGICTLIVISAFHVYKDGEGKKIWITGIKYIGYCIISIVLAYLFVNVYNMIAGGTWNDIKTYIYPIMSKEYNMFDILRTSLPHANAGHVVQFIFFAFTAWKVIYKLRKCSEEVLDKKRELICLIVSCSGIISLVYFINRTAAGNLSISHIQFVMVIAMYAEECLNIKKENLSEWIRDSEALLQMMMSFVAFFLVSWFAFEGIMDLHKVIEDRKNYFSAIDKIENDIEVFQEKIPQDTLAFGLGVPELYYEIGWNPQIAVTDWADMNHYSLEEVANYLAGYNSFVTMDGVSCNIPDEFEVVENVKINNYVYLYYERKNVE